MKYRLALFDMDSTLINEEIIDELAESAGKKDEVAAITERAMRGELDFKSALQQRVSFLKGLPQSVLARVSSDVTFSEGAEATVAALKARNVKVGVVSGGFHEVIDTALAKLNLDLVAANSLEIVDKVLTGRLIGPIIDADGKKEALIQFAASAAIPLSETIAVGDGANDIAMIKTAGLGVSFRGKEVLNRHASIVIEGSMTELLDHLHD